MSEYPQHMFLWRTGENNPIIVTKYSLTVPLGIHELLMCSFLCLLIISTYHSLSFLLSGVFFTSLDFALLVWVGQGAG